MTEYLNEEEKLQRMHEALTKILEQFERQGILRSEIREGLWNKANSIFTRLKPAEDVS